MSKVIKLRQRKSLPAKLRVAAYARVSRESERSTHSLAAQVSNYSELIQSNPEWEYAGVYIDSFVSGGRTAGRNGFNELIAECDAGNVDMIIVKSISRFARNTVDLLNTVRHLKELCITVFFEKERINTLSTEGEFILTVLASFAQEEISSMSNNIKWAIRHKFVQGIPIRQRKYLGYDWQNGEMIINESEAEVVRRLFRDYLGGSNVAELERAYTEEFPELNLGFHCISRILENEIYTGKLTLQKTYSVSPITKKCRVNKGELPFYVVDAHHEPIIDPETFEAAQKEKRRRAELGAFWNKYINTSVMTGKIKCGICGSSYIKNISYRNGIKHYYWICKKRTHGHAADCSGRNVPDTVIKTKFAEAYVEEYSAELFDELVSEIIVFGNDTLVFCSRDGGTISIRWELTGNKDKWTDEERRKRSDYAKLHPINKGKVNCFTSKIRCGKCGENFRRHLVRSNNTCGWGCASGKKVCGIRWLNEDELKRVLTEALELTEFDEKAFTGRVDHIVVLSNEELTICFKDGSGKTVPWNSKRRIPKNAKDSTNNTAND